MDNKQTNMHEAFFRFRKLNLSVLYPKLSSGEIVLLKFLKERSKEPEHANGTNVSEIACQMCMAPPAISRMLNAMEEKELILRTVNKSDRRNMLVQMTDRGRKMQQEAELVLTEFMEKIEAQVGKEKVAQVIETMNQMYECSKTELEKYKKSNK